MFFSFSLVSQCPVFPLLFQFLLSKNPASAWSWGHYRKKEQVEPNIVEPFSWVQRSKSAKWSSRTGNTSQTSFNGVIPLLSLSIRTQFLFCFAFLFFLFFSFPKRIQTIQSPSTRSSHCNTPDIHEPPVVVMAQTTGCHWTQPQRCRNPTRAARSSESRKSLSICCLGQIKCGVIMRGGSPERSASASRLILWHQEVWRCRGPPHTN